MNLTDKYLTEVGDKKIYESGFSDENTKTIYKKIRQKAKEIQSLITNYTSDVPKTLGRHLYVYMGDRIKEIDKELKK